MFPRPQALGLALLLAFLHGPARADGPGLSWSASAAADVGYDDNVTISPLARSGERQPSATAAVSAELGGQLGTGRVSSGLTYGFDHRLYFSYRELDMQSHEISAELELSLGRLAVTPEYGVEVNLRGPTAGVFYSVVHTGKLELDVTVHPVAHIIADYEIAYHDLRDEAYAYLGGTQHVARAYPRIFLGDAVLLGAGYRLEIARLGTTQDTITRGSGETSVELPLSHVGHFGFVNAYWEPVGSVGLLLLVKAGRRTYEPFTASASGGGGGRWDGTSSRADTLARVNALASWEVVRRLSLEANIVFEASRSTVSTRRLTGSYTNFIATLGLSFDYSSDD